MEVNFYSYDEIFYQIFNKERKMMLYQYRKIDENLEQTIKHNKLKFSSPNDFNDPYDCNGTIDCISSEKKNWANFQGIPIQCVEQCLKNDPQFIEKAVREKLNKIGICCFSKCYDSILMWSHYAKYHTGICLSFDTSKNQDFFHTIWHVKYSEMLPHFDFFANNPEDIKEIIRTKFEDWSYENEARIVKTEQNIKDNNYLRVFTFKNEALSGIIFGTKTSEENKDEIKEWCAKSGKNVKFSQMQLKQGTYGLEKVDLTD